MIYSVVVQSSSHLSEYTPHAVLEHSLPHSLLTYFCVSVPPLSFPQATPIESYRRATPFLHPGISVFLPQCYLFLHIYLHLYSSKNGSSLTHLHTNCDLSTLSMEHDLQIPLQVGLCQLLGFIPVYHIISLGSCIQWTKSGKL